MKLDLYKLHQHFLPRKPTRDFVYINDVVDANIYAFENPSVTTGIYDVGVGEYNAFERVLDLMNLKYFFLGDAVFPPWYQFNTCANKNKFMPNWEPKYRLETGIKEYKEYLLNNEK